MNFQLFYPYQPKKNAYLIPVLRKLREVLTLTTLALVIILYVGIGLMPVSFTIIINDIKIPVNFSLFNSQELISHLIPLAIMLYMMLMQYRKQTRHHFFYQQPKKIIIRFILYIWMFVTSIIALTTLSTHGLAMNIFNSLDKSVRSKITQQMFITQFTNHLHNSVVYWYFMVINILIDCNVVLKIANNLGVWCFVPRLRLEYAMYLKTQDSKKQSVSTFPLFLQTHYNLGIETYYNDDLKDFNPHHPIQFYKTHCDSSNNQKEKAS